MRAAVLAVVLLVSSALALPAAGFLTARNAPPACGANPAALQASALMQGSKTSTERATIGLTLTGRAMAEAAATLWFPAEQVPVAVAIAGAESSFNPDPPNPPTVAGGTMRGLWQINDGAHPDLVNASGRDWRNPVDNAWMAYQVWQQAGRSWTPWSTYNSGSYRRYLTDTDPTSTTTPTAASQGGQPIHCGDIDATLATWNSGAWNATGRVVDGFVALSRTADVIAGQELGSEARRKAIMNAVGDGFAMYPQPRCTGRNCGTRKGTSVPILVHTARFDVVAQGRTKAIPHKIRVEHGSDGNRTGPKFVTWVTLRDKTSGRVFSVVNTHLIVSATSGNRLDPAKPRRAAQYRKQLAITLQTADLLKATGPVVITCDCNATFDPGFATHGFQSSANSLDKTLKTHTNRTLDWVYTAGARPVAQRLGAAYGSDHQPLIVTYIASVSVDSVGTPAGFDMPGNRSVDEAIAYMTRMAADRTPIPAGQCLHYVALAYGHPTTAQQFGRYWARDVYTAMPSAYKHAGNAGTPPRGALVFWNTGSGPGHIALSLGNGKVASTDYPHAGVIGIAPITAIDQWGTRLGWTAPYFTGRTTSD